MFLKKVLPEPMNIVLLFLSFSIFFVLFLTISAGTIYMKHSIVLMKKKIISLGKEREIKNFEKNSLEALVKQKKEILFESIKLNGANINMEQH